MASEQQLVAGEDVVDLYAAYGYPVTCYVTQFKSGTTAIHIIWSFAAITPSSIVLAKAPNGSICIDVYSKQIWIKQTTGGAAGGIDGTWAYSAALT